MTETTDNLSRLKRALRAIDVLQFQVDTLAKVKHEPIAIIGLGCRFPGGADDPDSFWQLLQEGKDGITEIPPDRWPHETFYDPDPDAPGKIVTRYGGFFEPLHEFDASFFGISPREALSLDPQQRVLLEVSWEALEHAGLPPDQLEGSRTGVFIGICSNDYTQRLMSGSTSEIDAYLATGNSHSVASGRLSYLLGLQGPSLSVDTACSSSLVTVHLACQSLRQQDCDLALVGGVNRLLAPEFSITFSKAHMLAPDGRCKTFDAAADGFVRSEGCGVIVLKRLSDALQAGDSILAVIKGSAINQDGHSSGLTVPNGPSQQAVIRQALSNAKLTPEQISYIEAHGTGTALGDPIEVGALRAVFGSNRSPDHPLVVGSVKTNIGHLEGAAGIAGVIKTALALHHETIPGHLHFHRPNPHIDWDHSLIHIPVKEMSWSRGESPRRAGVSSFGFSGTNAHVILEEAPVSHGENAGTDRPLHLLTLSAKTREALDQLVRRYHQYFQDQPHALPDICFSANTGRAVFEHRLCLISSSSEQICEQIGAHLSGAETVGVLKGRPRRAQSPRVVFLFTGQGSQYVNMGRQLYETQPRFRQILEHGDQILGSLRDQSLLALLYPDQESDGTSLALDETQNTQPALFILEYALAQLWMSWGIQPAAVMGHSIGEYVAACVAGVFSFEEGVRLVAERGDLIHSLCQTGQMVAVFAPEKKIRSLLPSVAGEAGIAAINGPENIVISGYKEAVQYLVDQLTAEGIETRGLSVSHGFHSVLMDPALTDLEKILTQIDLKRPQLPLISNLTGERATDEITTAKYWCRQLRQPVQFAIGLNTLHRQGYDVFLEIGAKPILSRMGRGCLPENVGLWLSSLKPHDQDWQSLLYSLSSLYLEGSPINWQGFDQDYTRQRLRLPTYPFQRQRYWVVESGLGTTTQKMIESPEKLRKNSDPSQWFYLPSWQRSAPVRSDQSMDLSSHLQTWLVFADSGSLGLELGEKLQQVGQRVIWIKPGRKFTQSSDSVYLLDPYQPKDYEVLARTLRDTDQIPDQILHLWSLEQNSDQSRSDLGYQSLLWLTQAFGKQLTKHPVQITLIAEYLHDVVGGEDLKPHQATILGPCKVIPQEYPQIRCRVLDLDSSAQEHETRYHTDRLWSELAYDATDQIIAYRGTHRWIQTYEPISLSAMDPDSSLLKSGGVYIITGDLHRGLAWPLTVHLARSLQAKIIGLGHGDLSDQEKRSLTDVGAEFLHLEVDTTSESEMAAALDQITQRYGSLNGVLHVSRMGDLGNSEDEGQVVCPIQLLSPQGSQAHFRTKVDGLQVLAKVLQKRDLDFCLVQSSLSSVLGGVGFAAYAGANQFIDAFVAQCNQNSSFPWISVNWEAVNVEEGLETSLGAELAALSLTVEEVGLAVDRILSHGGLTQVVVSSGDLKARMESWLKREIPTAGTSDSSTSVSPQDRPNLATPYVPPSTEMEKTIVSIWQEFLSVQQIGIHDNFFDLGGHSLPAIQVISRLREKFQIEVPLRNLLLETPTVAGIAEMIAQTQAKEESQDEVEALLAMVENLSPEEIQARLAEEKITHQQGGD